MTLLDIILTAVICVPVTLLADTAFWWFVTKQEDDFKKRKLIANEAKLLQRQIRNGRTPRGL